MIGVQSAVGLVLQVPAGHPVARPGRATPVRRPAGQHSMPSGIYDEGNEPEDVHRLKKMPAPQDRKSTVVSSLFALGPSAARATTDIRGPLSNRRLLPEARLGEQCRLGLAQTDDNRSQRYPRSSLFKDIHIHVRLDRQTCHCHEFHISDSG